MMSRITAQGDITPRCLYEANRCLLVIIYGVKIEFTTF